MRVDWNCLAGRVSFGFRKCILGVRSGWQHWRHHRQAGQVPVGERGAGQAAHGASSEAAGCEDAGDIVRPFLPEHRRHLDELGSGQFGPNDTRFNANGTIAHPASKGTWTCENGQYMHAWVMFGRRGPYRLSANGKQLIKIEDGSVSFHRDGAVP